MWLVWCVEAKAAGYNWKFRIHGIVVKCCECCALLGLSMRCWHMYRAQVQLCIIPHMMATLRYLVRIGRGESCIQFSLSFLWTTMDGKNYNWVSFWCFLSFQSIEFENQVQIFWIQLLTETGPLLLWVPLKTLGAQTHGWHDIWGPKMTGHMWCPLDPPGFDLCSCCSCWMMLYALLR